MRYIQLCPEWNLNSADIIMILPPLLRTVHTSIVILIFPSFAIYLSLCLTSVTSHRVSSPTIRTPTMTSTPPSITDSISVLVNAYGE